MLPVSDRPLDPMVRSFQPNPQATTPLGRIPLDVLILCFSKLKLSDLGRLSCVNRECKELASHPRIWRIYCERMGLIRFEPNPKEAYRTESPFLSLIRKSFLKQEIHSAIAALEIWGKEIVVERGSVKMFTQIDLVNDTSKTVYLFKAIIDNDLALIYVAKNRFDSKIVRFNRNLDVNSSNVNECLFWIYRFDQHTGIAFIRPTEDDKMVRFDRHKQLIEDVVCDMLKALNGIDESIRDRTTPQ